MDAVVDGDGSQFSGVHGGFSWCDGRWFGGCDSSSLTIGRPATPESHPFVTRFT
jgi:hypothetical protein